MKKLKNSGLVTRAFIERFNDPPVHNWISLAGPQFGVYGVPDFNALCPPEGVYIYIYFLIF